MSRDRDTMRDDMARNIRAVEPLITEDDAEAYRRLRDLLIVAAYRFTLAIEESRDEAAALQSVGMGASTFEHIRIALRSMQHSL